MSLQTVNTENQQILLEELQTLLEQQEQLIKKSDFRNVEKLCGQADLIIVELAKIPMPSQLQSKKQYESLSKLYKKIELMMETEKDSICRQLKKIGSGKRTLRTYQYKI